MLGFRASFASSIPENVFGSQCIPSNLRVLVLAYGRFSRTVICVMLTILRVSRVPAVACMQVATRTWHAVADLVHAAGPALSVAQLALPATGHAASAEPADRAGAQHPDGLRLAFSGTTSGSIAVWDLSREQPIADADVEQVSLFLRLSAAPGWASSPMVHEQAAYMMLLAMCCLRGLT